MEIVIRSAKEEDVQAINSLNKEMHDYLSEQVGLKFSEEDLKDEKIDTSELNGIIVAEDTKIKKVVGYISFSQKPKTNEWYGKHIYLYEIAVDSDYRKQGIGHKLMKKLMDKCEKLKLNIKVDTLVTNTSTIEFYKKLGFKPYMTFFIKENNFKLKI